MCQLAIAVQLLSHCSVTCARTPTHIPTYTRTHTLTHSHCAHTRRRRRGWSRRTQRPSSCTLAQLWNRIPTTRSPSRPPRDPQVRESVAWRTQTHTHTHTPTHTHEHTQTHVHTRTHERTRTAGMSTFSTAFISMSDWEGSQWILSTGSAQATQVRDQATRAPVATTTTTTPTPTPTNTPPPPPPAHSERLQRDVVCDVGTHSVQLPISASEALCRYLVCWIF
jgi:hypothetical protein